MKEKRFLHIIGDIDDRHIAEAAPKAKKTLRARMDKMDRRRGLSRPRRRRRLNRPEA